MEKKKVASSSRRALKRRVLQRRISRSLYLLSLDVDMKNTEMLAHFGQVFAVACRDECRHAVESSHCHDAEATITDSL